MNQSWWRPHVTNKTRSSSSFLPFRTSLFLSFQTLCVCEYGKQSVNLCRGNQVRLEPNDGRFLRFTVLGRGKEAGCVLVWKTSLGILQIKNSLLETLVLKTLVFLSNTAHSSIRNHFLCSFYFCPAWTKGGPQTSTDINPCPGWGSSSSSGQIWKVYFTKGKFSNTT